MTLFKTSESLSGDIYEDCLCPDRLGLCPKVFYTGESNSIIAIDNNAAVLASKCGSGLDAFAIAEEAALGFSLGNRTVFDSVKRLLPWERIVSRGGKLVVESEQVGQPPPCVLESLSDQVCSALSCGAALELTGGLDSRLMLAVGLRRGVVPKLSFTIGEASSYDVVVASAIASEFHFRHRVIPVVVDEDRLKQDALDFIRLSGYGINATCYAWLPATLALLDDERTAQINGLVGEIAGSSYYTPFDPLIELVRLEYLWVKYRLIRPWIEWRRLWDNDILRKLEVGLLTEALQALNSREGTWRERTDLFYKHDKIGRWALPVLDASNNYYTVISPLLMPEYCAWAVSLPVAERVNRKNERGLLRRAHAQLADFQVPGGVTSSKSKATVMSKILGRLNGKKRESPLGTIQSAIVLSRDREIRDYVLAMAHESDAGFSPASIESLLDCPREHPELLGTIITAAVAWCDLQNHNVKVKVG